MSMAVPPLKALKHLMLCHDEYDDATSAAIGELRLLQTLRLSGRYGMADVIVCAPLELTGLLHLEEVAISNMVVRGGHVTLPSGCSLHVRVIGRRLAACTGRLMQGKGNLRLLNSGIGYHAPRCRLLCLGPAARISSGNYARLAG